MNNPVSAQILQEMKNYYRARSQEYDEWFYRRGRFDRGPALNQRWIADVNVVFSALDAFRLTGEVLELAAGTGIWTERLMRTASRVTAVDASPEMIELNQARLANNHRVIYVLADLFTWHPDRLYDAVFFGFWLSHVPVELLDAFLLSVSTMLRPGGKIFFVDSRSEPTASAINQPQPLVEKQLTTRLLNDGRAFKIVKNFYDPAEIVTHFTRVGFELAVYQTATYFIYACGTYGSAR